jgi:hypothetical protein
MKDIKSVELEKYSSGDYERVAFRVFHNKAGRNYCICITADEMDEMILDDLMTQYELNCTNDHCGEETVIDGKKVCIAEFETQRDTLPDLQKIMNFASVVGREIVDFDIDGNYLLCVRTGNAVFGQDGRLVKVPVYSVREDLAGGMLSFCERYPDKEFTAEIGRIIDSQFLPEDVKFRAVLLQGFRAILILEHKGETTGFVYGFRERKCLRLDKGKNLLTIVRGYPRG